METTTRPIIDRLASTRAVFVVVGIFTLILGHTTRVSYTTTELPTRDVCVLALFICGVVGIGSAFVKPNAVTRWTVGVMLMIVAAVRIAGFAIRDIRDTDGVVGFIEGTNAIWVWALVGYLGFLIWARRDVR